MKKMMRMALISTLALGVMAGCSSETDTIVMAKLPVVSNQFTPKTLWDKRVGNGVDHFYSTLSPVFDDGRVYVASRDGEVAALDPETGKVIWDTQVVLDNKKDKNARLSGGILSVYGKLYIGSEHGVLMALDAETGKSLWQIDVGAEVLTSPSADSNMIFVHTNAGTLMALDASDGSKKWTTSTDVPNLTMRGDSSPVAEGGGVFWGTASGRVSAAIAQTGQIIWQQPIGVPKGSTEIDRLIDVDGSPLIIGSTLYIDGINGSLTAIDLQSGQTLWKRNYSSHQNMATDGRLIYLNTDKDHLVAVDARSGTEIWQNSQLSYRQLTAPVLLGDYLVVGDSLGYLHWLDKSRGDFVSQQLIDKSGFAVGPVPMADGYLLITRDGEVRKQTLNK